MGRRRYGTTGATSGTQTISNIIDDTAIATGDQAVANVQSGAE